MARCNRVLRLGTSITLGLFLLTLIYQYTASWRLESGISARLSEDTYLPRYAFATFLGVNTQSASTRHEDDPYFMSIRQLAYKLLHAGPRLLPYIPLLVLCTDEVSFSKRARLEEDGLTVITVRDIPAPSIELTESTEPRWRDVFTKLRLFELTNYTKICYMDADTFVTDDLSGIFEDSAALPQRTLAIASNFKSDESPLPDFYVMAGHNDYTIDDYMNAGLFVLAPSVKMFDYYWSLLKKPWRFNPPGYLEQGLLNYAHRPNGNMPWKALSQEWYGKTHHDKFWRCETPEGCPGNDYVIGKKWKAQREEMRRYWGRSRPG